MVFTQNKYLKVFICLLLCVTILSFSMFGEVEEADALVLTSTVIAGLAVMLTAVGVTFATRTQLNDTCSNYLNWRGSSSLTRAERQSTAIQLATDGALELTANVVNDLKQFIQTMTYVQADSVLSASQVVSGFNLAEGDISPTTVANITFNTSASTPNNDIGIQVLQFYGTKLRLSLVSEGSVYALYLSTYYDGGSYLYRKVGTITGSLPITGSIQYAYDSSSNKWYPFYVFPNLTFDSAFTNGCSLINSYNGNLDNDTDHGRFYLTSNFSLDNALDSSCSFYAIGWSSWTVWQSIENATVSGSNTIAVSVPYNGDYAPDSGEDDETTTGETIYIPTGLIVDGSIADSIPTSLTPTGVRENPSGGGGSSSGDDEDGNPTIIGLLSNILSALGGFVDSILSSLPTILALISGYTLFQNLFTHFLPTQVATILWAFWLTTMAIWLFRMIADR